MKKLLLLAIVVLGISAASFGQTISPAATSTATLVTPISITKDANLDFGKIGSSDTDGSITLSTAGVPLGAGGASVIPGGTPSAAEFTVKGESTYAVIVEFPSTLTLTGETNTGNTLTVSPIVSSTGLSGASSNLVGGNLTVKIGGTLTIPKNTVKDTYKNTETLKITAHYQ